MPQTHVRRTAVRRAARLFVMPLALLAACSGDDFDRAQVPVITLTPVIAAPLVTIAWTPAGAQQIAVYRGTIADGSAANLVWSVGATSDNSLASPIEYGASAPVGGTTQVAAQRLVPGQPYTVQISRLDPRNPAGSVSGAQYRYQSTQTFTLAASITPP